MNKPRKVPGEGRKDARIVIVGEAPGAKEEAEGRPFIGYSGTLLRYSLERAGFQMKDVYITNVCKYRPPYNLIDKWCPKSTKRKGPKGRTPNELVKEGMYELYKEIAEINPGVIVPVGNVALWALTGKEQITRRRGSMLSAEIGIDRAMHVVDLFSGASELEDCFKAINGKRVVPTFHPAAVQRMYSLKPIFEFDLKRAFRAAFDKKMAPPERQYFIDPDQETAYALAEKLLQGPYLSYDIETPGANFYCIAFSSDPSWALVLRGDAQWKWELIRNLLESQVPKIGQNVAFDASFMRMHHGIVANNIVHDTMVAQKTCYPEFKSGLDFQTSFYTLEPYYKDEGKDQDLRYFSDAMEYMTYNAKDAAVTLECALAQMNQELKNPANAESFRASMAEHHLVVDIMSRGLRINHKRMAEHRREFKKRAIETQKILDETVLKQLAQVAMTGKTEPQRKAALSLAKKIAPAMEQPGGALNVGSSKDLQTYLYDVRGFPVKKKKDKYGKMVPTSDEKALKELYGETKDPVLLTIVSIRKDRKMISSYLNANLGDDGRLHFSINLAGTKTLRWSSGKTVHGWGFNAQTMPPQIRDIIIADPGYVLFYADLSQVEDRIVAYLARVQKKIWAFENDIDAHALTASGIFKVTVEDVLRQAKVMKSEGKTPPWRYLGKQSNHAFNYGEAERTFMQNVNKKADETGISITLQQSKQIRAGHFAMYPEIETNYWAEVEDALRRTRTLVNPFGRRRVFHDRLDNSTYRDGYSWIPQSTAPDIIRRGMVNINRELQDGARIQDGLPLQILLQVHDAILGQVREDMVDQLAPEILRCMDVPVPIHDQEIHIPTDIKFGESWKELG